MDLWPYQTHRSHGSSEALHLSPSSDAEQEDTDHTKSSRSCALTNRAFNCSRGGPPELFGRQEAGHLGSPVKRGCSWIISRTVHLARGRESIYLPVMLTFRAFIVIHLDEPVWVWTVSFHTTQPNVAHEEARSRCGSTTIRGTSTVVQCAGSVWPQCTCQCQSRPRLGFSRLVIGVYQSVSSTTP